MAGLYRFDGTARVLKISLVLSWLGPPQGSTYTNERFGL